MASLIDHFEQQYSVLTAEITADIGRLRIVGTEDRRDIINKISSNINEAHELLEQIELEIREADPILRSGLTHRLNCYQMELKRLELENRNSTTKINIQTVGYESPDDYNDISLEEDQKQRLLSNSERIERTGKHLEEGYRIVLETEQIGAQVLQNLNTQKETILKSRTRLRDISSDLGRSSRVMNSMIIRSIREKAILYGIGLICMVGIAFSLYLSLRD